MTTILRNYFEFGTVVQEMLFKRDHFYSSVSPNIWWSGTIYAILVEAIMGTIPVKLF